MNKDAQNKTILVTGGAGYIGSFAVKELLNDGFKVIVLDSLENGHEEAVDPRAILEVCDTADSKKVDKIFKKYQPIAVIDFAAYLSVGESMENPKKYMENNVVNFVKLLDVMAENGCKYIIKSSTASTYGNPEYNPVREDYQEDFPLKESALLTGTWEGVLTQGEDFFQKFIEEFNSEIVKSHPFLRLAEQDLGRLRIPTNVYGLSKLFDEIILKKYDSEKGLKNICLRYFNVSGASLNGEMGEDKPRPTTLMTLVFWSLLGKIPKLTVFGNDYPTKDGTGIRDYIHPIDLARGHFQALKFLLENERSDTFNLGTGTPYSVLEVIASAEKASGKKVNLEYGRRRPGDPAEYYADPTKANGLLDWHAQYDLDDMAKTAWLWHSQNPDGYSS